MYTCLGTLRDTRGSPAAKLLQTVTACFGLASLKVQSVVQSLEYSHKNKYSAISNSEFLNLTE